MWNKNIVLTKKLYKFTKNLSLQRIRFIKVLIVFLIKYSILN